MAVRRAGSGSAPDRSAAVLDEVGAAVDALGGRFTMPYTTVALTAPRSAST
ncbi:hypothetical protein [Streptomyces aureus]|uniref:hypothetical protein n=1 Tax=Streptomyces aureus TaxID=193461 RepID=UPI0036AE876B